jgi:demethylmenaquinone methyltransferase/2-methoxy-6-polyprenyl-1,4-benzoquinol methylase
VTNKQQALNSIYKTLKPGGKLLILEFSKPMSVIQPIYDLYSFKVLPFLGDLVAKDADSYRYLAESIRMHPDQNTLITMMEEANLERCRFQNFTGGIVALHEGYKF